MEPAARVAPATDVLSENRIANSLQNLLRFFHFPGELAGEDMPEHDKIGYQTHGRISKGGRLILLKEKMPDPGKPIATDGDQGDQPAWTHEHPKKEKCNQACRADKMKCPTGGMLVLGEVIGIEFFEVGVLLWHNLNRSGH